ncbi:uncharacterized protein LOC18021887 [Eutrema salsugineum]|uniref:uncharacterized protein LOC18021887 n=1 Tax=Eutrema salsugineum TaxID=72664 RepID=UPI000CED5315|nr:uncharacterized protein LOC18021887 [Eutrema salsugineum]
MFEYGSGSGAARSPPNPTLALENVVISNEPSTPVAMDVDEGNLVDDGEENLFGEEVVPFDWEDIADDIAAEELANELVGENLEGDTDEAIVEADTAGKVIADGTGVEAGEVEFTEEDLRLMEECERKLMEDDLLENDDLLGEELDDEIADVSQERTISETPIPVTRASRATPASSQSPTSRRTRSHKSSKTSHLAGEDISKMNGNPPNTGSRKLVEPKRRIPRSPKGVGVAISRKLKPFKSRTSPMKKSGPTLGSAKGLVGS